MNRTEMIRRTGELQEIHGEWPRERVAHAVSIEKWERLPDRWEQLHAEWRGSEEAGTTPEDAIVPMTRNCGLCVHHRHEVGPILTCGNCPFKPDEEELGCGEGSDYRQAMIFLSKGDRKAFAKVSLEITLALKASYRGLYGSDDIVGHGC